MKMRQISGMAVLTMSAIMMIAGTAVAQRRSSEQQPGIGWTEQQLRQAVAPARVGRKLTPAAWPGYARVAVCLSFDVDNESYLLASGETSPNTLSTGDFGAETGLPRVLRLLDRYELPASFFIPAVSALLHPEMVPAILKSGKNEIGVHGWIHEYLPALKSQQEEEELLDRAIAYLTKASGKRPVGYRAPGWSFSEHTVGLLRKKGFLYDSSLMAMDEPYELMSNGESTGMAELAIDWTLTETPYLGRGGTMPSPEHLFQLYKEEFDGAYQEGTLFVLTLHPQFIGHRAPMYHLEQFIAYMKSKPGVWFATGEQIAQYVKTTQPRTDK
ncbi:MAG TPA: polysaccharide deacetylase [Candidatus Angelobacter sp.]|nr:polysaccharide deacetylase [Candidatus Angelobacter sp.]